MDKLTALKQLLTSSFSKLVVHLQKGYPMQNYNDIREAMFAINLFESTTIDALTQETIIDYYLRKLNNI